MHSNGSLWSEYSIRAYMEYHCKVIYCLWCQTNESMWWLCQCSDVTLRSNIIDYSKACIIVSVVVLYLDKNSQAVKKGAALFKMASIKKLWNPRWRPRNGCDGRLMAQILIAIIQVNLCCLLPASLGLGTKLTWIIAIKICAITYHHSHFLAASLDFKTFFILAILNRAAHFFTAWLFLSR